VGANLAATYELMNKHLSDIAHRHRFQFILPPLGSAYKPPLFSAAVV